jgi:hypothetical protein
LLCRVVFSLYGNTSEEHTVSIFTAEVRSASTELDFDQDVRFLYQALKSYCTGYLRRVCGVPGNFSRMTKVRKAHSQRAT